jgi:hypothetical protein
MSTWHICLERFLAHNLPQKENPTSKSGDLISAGTTIAIWGGNSVVGRALEALLQGVGYDTRLIEDPPEGDPEECLDGVRLLLLAPTLSSESRETLLVEMGDTLESRDIPVLTLSTGFKEALGDGRVSIPWPCRIEDLTKRIEASLLPLPRVGNT